MLEQEKKNYSKAIVSRNIKKEKKFPPALA